MRYPQAFFAIQLAFAQKIAALSGQPYREAVLRNTALYRILGLDWTFDPNAPVWKEYCAGLKQNELDAGWTHQFYLTHLEDIPEYDMSHQRWGCFSHEYKADAQTIRLHFSGALDRSGYGPLTSLRKEARVTELRAMFRYIHEHRPEARLVQGASWLYNRKEYTRLFPDEYAQAVRPETEYFHAHLRARGLWGQFLRSTGQINEQVASLFLTRLEQLQEPDRAASCFPYLPMWTEAPVEVFYRLYGLV